MQKGAEKVSVGGPRAVSRVLDLFKLLSTEIGGMSLTEISLALDVSKSTFVDTLRGLSIGGFLIQEGAKYRLGPAAFRLAATIMSSCSSSDIIRHYVRELAGQTRESVGFAIVDWEIGQAIYSEAVNSTQPVHYAMRSGIRAPLYASAAGRVLLAFAPIERANAYLSNARLKPFTGATLTDREAILCRLRQVRQTGYCASFGEMLTDTAAIAAPVYDPDNQVAGALILAAPLARMKINFDTLLPQVLETALAASGRAAAR